jgi:broad specificity phosphatase PhoE
VTDSAPGEPAGVARRLILVRHGQTVWNLERRFTTRTDVELSDAGVEQARIVAEALAPVRIDRIYSSPLVRALRTAEMIAAAQAEPCPVVTDGRLTEIDAGPFEGKTEQELEAGPLAAEFARWHTDGVPEFPAGSEPFDAALARASQFLDEHDGEPGTTLVSTHGSLARLIVCSHFLGGPPPLHRRLWLDNGRLAVFEWRGGVPKMVAFNAERV